MKILWLWLIGVVAAPGLAVPSPLQPSGLAERLRKTTNALHAVLVESPKTAPLGEGIESTALVFRQTQWELKNEPQSMTLSQQLEKQAMALPEAERLGLMNRFDNFTQIWLVSLQKYPQADARFKALLPSTTNSNRYHRELAFLGKGKGQAWYAYMPLHDWVYLQQQLGLEVGDDPLAAAMLDVAVDDWGSMTRNSAEAILTAGGAKAIPYLRQLLATTNFGIALRALGPMKANEATTLLVEIAGGADLVLAADARYMLESYPRMEAGRLYVKWLEQDIGKEPVYRVLEACAQVTPKSLEPFLPQIMNSPKSIYEFRRAFELSRSLAGTGIPVRLLKLEEEIKEFGYASSSRYSQSRVERATRELLLSNDIEAIGVIAISLATATTKGDWSPANKAGLMILDRLPNGYGRELARRVADSIPEDWIKQKLR